MVVVHAFDDDNKETCKACGRDWPCPGWWSQQNDMVRDPDGLRIALDTYRDASPPARARLKTGWIGGAHGSE